MKNEALRVKCMFLKRISSAFLAYGLVRNGKTPGDGWSG